MNAKLNTKEFTIKEGKRTLKGPRNYEVYSSLSDLPIYTIKENLWFHKRLFRIIGGAGFSAIKQDIVNAEGVKKYSLHKPFNVATVASYKLLNTDGEVITMCSNKIKWKDDSFIEIMDKSKKETILNKINNFTS